ncbi:DNAse I-like superfamily protein, partial [Striga hermonthica]
EDHERRHRGYECKEDFDRQSQASNYREQRVPDKPRITLSTFRGSDPDAWLNRAMQYLELNETDGPDRVRYASYYLDGEANVWWQWLTRIYRKNWEEWYDLKVELDRAHQKEEVYWRMKSRAMWLKEGDRNSRFFHAVVAQRRKSNTIQRLVTGEGVICASKESIVHHLEGFYSNLFSFDGSSEEDE